jgi:hypothetical protein
VNYRYGTDINKIIEIEKQYDALSVVKPGQSQVAWAVSVRIQLQKLLTNQGFSLQGLGIAGWLILTIVDPESIRVKWSFAFVAGNW